MFVGVMAWVTLQNGYSWRWLAFIAALPPFLVLCCFTFIPESPRWLIANGREREAKEVLRKMALMNGVELVDFTIVPEEVCLCLVLVCRSYLGSSRGATVLLYYSAGESESELGLNSASVCPLPKVEQSPLHKTFAFQKYPFFIFLDLYTLIYHTLPYTLPYTLHIPTLPVLTLPYPYPYLILPYNLPYPLPNLIPYRTPPVLYHT